MPSQTEPTVNVEFGNLLRGMLGACEVRSEHTGLIAGQASAQIDNLVTAPGRSPVAVEAEFHAGLHRRAGSCESLSGLVERAPLVYQYFPHCSMFG